MRDTTTILGLSLLIIACGGADSGGAGGSSSDSPTPAAASAASYDEALAGDPCALLTPAMVAAVAGVPESQLEQRAMKTGNMCIYSWDGGNASIAFVKVHDSADKARSRFESEHQSMTGEEVSAAMAEIGKRTKEKLEEDAAAGEDVPDPEQVEPVTGAMAEALDGGISFEPVTGVGDLAAYETTRHETRLGGQVFVSYANKLDVLTGNLTFDITFALDDEPGEAKMYRNEAIALARAVLDGLPR